MAVDADLSGLPPGPTGPSALVAMRFLLRGPKFLEQCRDRYGDVFTIRLNTGRTVVIAGDPAIAKEVFQGSPDDLHAGAGNVVLKPILGGRSVLLLDGPEHLRQRRLMLPPFHGERMRAYGETMTRGGRTPHRRMARRTSRSRCTRRCRRSRWRSSCGPSSASRTRPACERLGAPLKRLLNSTDQPLRLLSLQFTRSAGASRAARGAASAD